MKPATWSSNRSVVRFLAADRLAPLGLAGPCPAHMEAAMAAGGRRGRRWRWCGARWAVLHSALAWAVAQQYLRRDPLEGMLAPSQPTPRQHLLPAEVARLLVVAARQVEGAKENLSAAPANARLIVALFVAEQTRLLVRLAADTGARRGELAVLRLVDLDGRVLTIERGLSLEVLGTTKTNRNRRVTLGATTAAMIVEHFDTWRSGSARPRSSVTGSSRRASVEQPTPAPTCSHTASNASGSRPACPRPAYTGSATASGPAGGRGQHQPAVRCVGPGVSADAPRSA